MADTKAKKPAAPKKIKPEQEAAEAIQKTSEKKEITFKQLIESLIAGYSQSGTDAEKAKTAEVVKKYLNQAIEKSSLKDKFNIIILYDSSTMIKSDADSIYSSVTAFSERKPLLMVLYSGGGSISSAYLIGKLCREYSSSCFVIAVPRHAKSAATLLCCAADEIHMGSLSELGPIDPQINNLPALGLKNSIEHIAKLVKDTPESAEMFAKYLHYSLKPIDIGYYERVAESASQYAAKLLETHAGKLPKKAERIAQELVYTYKDHGFVIDKTDAQQLFGEKIVFHNTEEYKLGNILYQELSLIENIANYLGYSFHFIGSIDSDPTFTAKK